MRSSWLAAVLASGFALFGVAPWAHATERSSTPAAEAPTVTKNAKKRKKKRAAAPPAPAAAPTVSDEDRARSAFSDGKTHAAEGRYVKACKAFEESLALVEGVGTMYHLADCYEKLGKSASAQRMFLRAARVAGEAAQPERAEAARERAVSLEPKLARLRVLVEAIDTSVQVKDGDERLEPGTTIAVDPGPHRVTASAPGKQPWSTTVRIPHEPVTMTLIVPALEAAPAPPRPTSEPSTARAAAQPARVTARPAETGSQTQRHLAMALGGIGIASLVTGGVFALQYKVSNDEAKAVCPTGLGCTRDEIADHRELVDDARTARMWSYVAFGAGAAAVGGATLLFLWPRGGAAESKIAASASVAPDGSWNAALGGSF